MLERIIRYIAYIFFKLLFRLEVKNKDNIPEVGGVIIAANHTSYLDPPLIGSVLRRRPTFIARESLFKVPLIGSIIRAYSIGVKREGPGPSTLKKAVRVLKKGGLLVVFPEGSRSKDGRLMEIKRGVGLMAALTEAQVIPAYIKGAHNVLPVGAVIPRPYKIKIIFGKPIKRRKDETDKDYEERVTKEVYSELRRLSHS
ncbi:MAG: 1-acyl-sn-glycerol-3-phosphate acyltransferase [Thermodesulfovibrionales bacterium]|nr:1-acyl-sn-glycerol-3-phosphate acyltransferase [Thermodesulfovibrionales bacterium]